MGSVKEDIATKIAVNDTGLCEWTRWETLPQCYKDTVFYPIADQILSLVCKRIEGAKLKPKEALKAYNDGKKKWLNSEDSYKYDDETYAFLNIAQTQLQHCVDAIKEE